MAYVVIWSERGVDNSHCRVFKEQRSADEAAARRRAEGYVVTVVDTRWGVRSVISTDTPPDEAGAEVPAQAMEAGDSG